MSSTDPEYTPRPQRLLGRRWKQFAPNRYRWNIRRLATGRVLDVGCGIGRCLDFVRPRGVGVDSNETAVAVCRSNRHEAHSPEDVATPYIADGSGEKFDSLLCSQILELLDESTRIELIRSYLPHLVDARRVILITPQERGQRSDATHVRFVDKAALTTLVEQGGLYLEGISSFPLPRLVGRWFVDNETVTTARMPRR